MGNGSNILYRDVDRFQRYKKHIGTRNVTHLYINMSDMVFKCIVKVYRYMKTACSTSLRFLRQRVMLFRLFEIPVYMSYSFFLLVLPSVLLYFLTELSLQYIFSSSVILLSATFISVLVHELGHAFFVRRAKLRVDHISISAMYGACRYSHSSNAAPPVIIVYGGILAQALLCLLLYGAQALFYSTFYDSIGYIWHLELFVRVLIIINKLMIVINLLPMPGLDGEKIWAHVRSLVRI